MPDDVPKERQAAIARAAVALPNPATPARALLRRGGKRFCFCAKVGCGVDVHEWGFPVPGAGGLADTLAVHREINPPGLVEEATAAPVRDFCVKIIRELGCVELNNDSSWPDAPRQYQSQKASLYSPPFQVEGQTVGIAPSSKVYLAVPHYSPKKIQPTAPCRWNRKTTALQQRP